MIRGTGWRITAFVPVNIRAGRELNTRLRRGVAI
jgi:hypothetical protein